MFVFNGFCQSQNLDRNLKLKPILLKQQIINGEDEHLSLKILTALIV